MDVVRSNLKVVDLDSTGLLPEVMDSVIEDTTDVVVIEGDEHSYLLGIEKEVDDVEDLVCTTCMLCMSKGIYYFSIHYMDEGIV